MLRGHCRLSCAVAAAAFLTTAAPAIAKPGPTLRFTLDPNVSTPVDLAPAGPSVGDRWAIDSRVIDASGVAGTFRADQTAIAVGRTSQTVQTQGVWELRDGSITFAGVARAPLVRTGLTVGDSYERAVTGGTGRYAGASGTVVTRGRPDGVYEQILRLVLPDGAPTPLSIPGVEGPAEQRIDLASPGILPGDLIAARGTIADPPGGTVVGTQAIVAQEGADLRVLSSLTFGLPTGQVAVVGPGAIASDATTLVDGRTFDRAVVGGTGAYVGRGGTQSVVREADGTYRNALQLWAPRGKVLRLRLTGHNTATTTADVANGTARFEVFQDRLVNSRGRRVGRLLGVRTSVLDGGTPTSVQTLMTLRLPGGTVLVGGAQPQPNARTVSPVIGGSGRYAGMRGTLTATRGPKQTYVNVLRLQRVG
jgi:hypothetical protein